MEEEVSGEGVWRKRRWMEEDEMEDEEGKDGGGGRCRRRIKEEYEGLKEG